MAKKKYVPAKYQTKKQKKYTHGKGANIDYQYLTAGQKKHRKSKKRY